MSDGVQPICLHQEAATATQYPIDSLSPRMREAVEAIAAHVQAPLALSGQTVIGAAAHLAQTRINAPHRFDENGMPCSLNLLTLGGSGDRKSACRFLAFRSIDAHEKELRSRALQQYKDTLAKAEFLKGQARNNFFIENPLPPDPCSLYTDATFESLVGDFIRGKAAASWDTDEGGQVLAGASLTAETRVATVGGLCKAFDNGRFERFRSRGNVEGSGFAYNRRLTIHLLAQPVAVASALSDPLLQGQGFLPRFLFASPDSIAGTRFLDEGDLCSSVFDDARLRRYWLHCEKIIGTRECVDFETGEVVPPVLEFGTGVERFWMRFYNEIEAEQGDLGRFCNIRAFAGRAGELARRLGAVMSFFEERDCIDLECMRSSCDIVRYSLSEWMRYVNNERADPVRLQAIKLLEWLNDPRRSGSWDEFHRDRLGKSGPSLLRRNKVRDKVLDILVEFKYLFTSDGRHFTLNPLAKRADSAESPLTRPSCNAEALRASEETPLTALLRKFTADDNVL